MRNIAEIDRNFQTASVDGMKLEFHNALAAPFAVEGFAWRSPGGPLYRLPEHFTTAEINKDALLLAHHTAGGAVRFRTDSAAIVLRARLAASFDMNHMPRTGSAGFDLYRREHGRLVFTAAAQPNRDQKLLEIPLVREAEGGETEYLLNLPLYGGVEAIDIGLAPGSSVSAPPPHRIAHPVLFYGSSITLGGCASRPGNCYTSLLCRALDAEQLNLGFSGSGKGEIALAEAIGRLSLSCAVLDYDYNAPDAAHLEATHGPFFQAIRRRRPDLPILLVSKCDFRGTESDARRREIIRRTYDRALGAGDRFVWFLDGETLFGAEERDACTVDGCHPNDLGFYRIYRAMLPVLRQLIHLKSSR
ncbi:SGNH/GDSL hydrolase family protein [Victivallis vadensis]|uniref:SGNH/GDSL hydrolase family protein n=1 Tax=Victivallis vadensis TaxID=172901 RepID=UPI00266BA682|nr:SGNH/GDSL hydrolase family protein [Victivallis vadensis]